MTRTDRRRSAVALVLCLAAPTWTRAQGTVTLAAGASPAVTVNTGAKLGVPIIVDMSAATAGTNLASFVSGVNWGIARLTFDSIKAGTFGTLIANLGGAAGGSIGLNLANATGTITTVTVWTAFFTAGTAGGTRVMLTPTAAGNATPASILGLTLARALDVCVLTAAPTWGDATGDNILNIIDAQQVARFSVGLSVANLAAVQSVGDVTADAVVNIVDAQQIARFSVGLSTVPLAGTLQFTPPPAASVTLTPGAPTVAAGAGIQLTATPQDAGAGSLSGCAPVTWASADPTKATVNASGYVRGIAGGTSLITATSGGQNASVTVTVTAPPAQTLALTLTGAGGGGVTSAPAGIACSRTGGVNTGTCSTNFAFGSPVTLTATTNAGSAFTGWSGACTGTGTCVVTMDQARAVTATWSLSGLQLLTITFNGLSQGSVTSSPAGINCAGLGSTPFGTCIFSFAAGTPVTLTASITDEDGNPLSVWGGWSGACSGLSLTCIVTMDQPRTATAKFNNCPGLCGFLRAARIDTLRPPPRRRK